MPQLLGVLLREGKHFRFPLWLVLRESGTQEILLMPQSVPEISVWLCLCYCCFPLKNLHFTFDLEMNCAQDGQEQLSDGLHAL